MAPDWVEEYLQAVVTGTDGGRIEGGGWVKKSVRSEQRPPGPFLYELP